MKISFTVPLDNLQTANGFGQASYQIVSSLTRLGHEVTLFDSTAPIEFAFCQPDYWQWWNKDSYKIGYVPWESTKIPRNWKYLLRGCDELWTTSPKCAEWLKAEGFEAKVFQHGVDHSVWSPVKRVQNGPVKLLHIGEPALRKGGPLVLEKFTEDVIMAYDARLTIKSHGPTDLKTDHRSVTIIEEEYSEDDLVKLVHDHDVLIYPSYGEGFGLIPLQAMSTGMPTIITGGWAPYEYLVPGELVVKTRPGPTPWPRTHPGNMLHPDGSDLASAMRHIIREFNRYSQLSYDLAADVHRDYDWDRLTEEAFAPIVAKFES